MSSPAELFLRLWFAASQWSPSKRRNVDRIEPKVDEQLKKALRIDDDIEAVSKLEEIIASFGDGSQYRGLVLLIMRRIDELFLEVHPRSLRLSPVVGRRSALPEWLVRAASTRRSSGVFGEAGEHWLVARGPLSRRQRGEHESFADSLDDRFSALSVVPKCLKQESRRIDVAMRVIDVNAISGVPGIVGRSVGEERICAVPLAEEPGEISLTEHTCGDTTFVTFSPVDEAQVAKRLVSAIASAVDIDIGVGPEFLVPHLAASSAISELRKLAKPPCRLLLLGSGATKEVEDGQPWNEASIVNGIGTLLWRQRKIWPASIDDRRAAEYGLSDAGKGQRFENNAAGKMIEIVDIDSVGRCVVLICQDFEATPMTPELLRRWQPDWVFVPIMDRGVVEGGWFHRRAQALANYSHARFVAVTSTGLPRSGAGGPTACLLVACANSGDGVAPDRAMTCKPVDRGTKPGLATVDFGDEPWKKTTTVAK